MAALQRLAHGLDVADALEGEVGAAAGQVDQVRDEIALDLGGEEDVRAAVERMVAKALWNSFNLSIFT